MFVLAQLEDYLIFIFLLWNLRCKEENEKGDGRLYILLEIFILSENPPFLGFDILAGRFYP